MSRGRSSLAGLEEQRAARLSWMCCPFVCCGCDIHGAGSTDYSTTARALILDGFGVYATPFAAREAGRPAPFIYQRGPASTLGWGHGRARIRDPPYAAANETTASCVPDDSSLYERCFQRAQRIVETSFSVAKCSIRRCRHALPIHHWHEDHVTSTDGDALRDSLRRYQDSHLVSMSPVCATGSEPPWGRQTRRPLPPTEKLRWKKRKS